MHPAFKHWHKRPLHSRLKEYAACKVVSIWRLAEVVMKEVDDAGAAGTICLCRQVMQQRFQDADKVLADEEAKYVCLLAQVVLRCKCNRTSLCEPILLHLSAACCLVLTGQMQLQLQAILHDTQHRPFQEMSHACSVIL